MLDVLGLSCTLYVLIKLTKKLRSGEGSTPDTADNLEADSILSPLSKLNSGNGKNDSGSGVASSPTSANVHAAAGKGTYRGTKEGGDSSVITYQSDHESRAVIAYQSDHER